MDNFAIAMIIACVFIAVLIRIDTCTDFTLSGWLVHMSNELKKHLWPYAGNAAPTATQMQNNLQALSSNVWNTAAFGVAFGVAPSTIPPAARKSTEPPLAWRYWQLTKLPDGWALLSINQGSVWETPILRAEKTQQTEELYFDNAGVMQCRHKPASEKNFHGIYAFKRTNPALEMTGYPVEGEVELLGRVWVWTLGYRAEMARVKNLTLRMNADGKVMVRKMPVGRAFALNDTGTTSFAVDPAEISADLSRRYDCDVKVERELLNIQEELRMQRLAQTPKPAHPAQLGRPLIKRPRPPIICPRHNKRVAACPCGRKIRRERKRQMHIDNVQQTWAVVNGMQFMPSNSTIQPGALLALNRQGQLVLAKQPQSSALTQMALNNAALNAQQNALNAQWTAQYMQQQPQSPFYGLGLQNTLGGQP